MQTECRNRVVFAADTILHFPKGYSISLNCCPPAHIHPFANDRPVSANRESGLERDPRANLILRHRNGCNKAYEGWAPVLKSHHHIVRLKTERRASTCTCKCVYRTSIIYCTAPEARKAKCGHLNPCQLFAGCMPAAA